MRDRRVGRQDGSLLNFTWRGSLFAASTGLREARAGRLEYAAESNGGGVHDKTPVVGILERGGTVARTYDRIEAVARLRCESWQSITVLAANKSVSRVVPCVSGYCYLRARHGSRCDAHHNVSPSLDALIRKSDEVAVEEADVWLEAGNDRPTE